MREVLDCSCCVWLEGEKEKSVRKKQTVACLVKERRTDKQQGRRDPIIVLPWSLADEDRITRSFAMIPMYVQDAHMTKRHGRVPTVSPANPRKDQCGRGMGRDVVRSLLPVRHEGRSQPRPATPDQEAREKFAKHDQ